MFVGSCDGATSSEQAMGRGGNIVLVVLICCWSPRRCPLAVAVDFGRWWRIKLVVRPGHDRKCPLWMALRRVDTTGLKAAAWRKEARSALVADVRMALAMDWDLEARVGVGGRIGLERGDGAGLVLAPRTLAGSALV